MAGKRRVFFREYLPWLVVIGTAIQPISMCMAAPSSGTLSDPFVTEIKYDSGKPKGNTIPLTKSGGGRSGGEIAVRFTPPWYPAKVEAVKFYA